MEYKRFIRKTINGLAYCKYDHNNDLTLFLNKSDIPFSFLDSDPQFFVEYDSSGPSFTVIDRECDDDGYTWVVDGYLYKSEDPNLKVDGVILTMPKVIVYNDIFFVKGITVMKLGEVINPFYPEIDSDNLRYNDKRGYIILDDEDESYIPDSGKDAIEQYEFTKKAESLTESGIGAFALMMKLLWA